VSYNIYAFNAFQLDAKKAGQIHDLIWPAFF